MNAVLQNNTRLSSKQGFPAAAAIKAGPRRPDTGLVKHVDGIKA